MGIVITVASIRTERVLSSQNCPAIRMSIILRSNTRNQTTIPSKTSANAHRTLRLHSNSNSHCGNGNMGGTITGIGSALTTAVGKVSTVSLTTISRGVLSLSNARCGSAFKTGTVLNVSVTITQTTTTSTQVPLCIRLNNPSSILLPIPYFGIVGNNVRTSGDISFRRFVVTPMKTSDFSRTVRFKTSTCRTLGSILGSTNCDAKINSRNNFTPGLGDGMRTMRVVLGKVRGTKLHPNASVTVTLSPTIDRLCRRSNDCLFFGSSGDHGASRSVVRL